MDFFTFWTMSDILYECSIWVSFSSICFPYKHYSTKQDEEANGDFVSQLLLLTTSFRLHRLQVAGLRSVCYRSLSSSNLFSSRRALWRLLQSCRCQSCQEPADIAVRGNTSGDHYGRFAECLARILCLCFHWSFAVFQ